MITRSQGDGHIDRCKGQQCAKWRYFTWSARPLNMFEICSLNLIPQFESRELKEGENPKWEGRRGETLEGLTESRNPTPKSSGSTPLKSIYVFRWHLCFGSKCWQKQVVGGGGEVRNDANCTNDKSFGLTLDCFVKPNFISNYALMPVCHRAENNNCGWNEATITSG